MYGIAVRIGTRSDARELQRPLNRGVEEIAQPSKADPAAQRGN